MHLPPQMPRPFYQRAFSATNLSKNRAQLSPQIGVSYKKGLYRAFSAGPSFAASTSLKRPFNQSPIRERLFMKRLISSSLTLFITFCLLVATDRRAWGYVDPGSGLIALQTFASVGAAYAYFIRRRIRAFFASKQKSPVEVLPAESTKSRELA
jgi:hypothetical protein